MMFVKAIKTQNLKGEHNTKCSPTAPAIYLRCSLKDRKPANVVGRRKENERGRGTEREVLQFAKHVVAKYKIFQPGCRPLCQNIQQSEPRQWLDDSSGEGPFVFSGHGLPKILCLYLFIHISWGFERLISGFVPEPWTALLQRVNIYNVPESSSNMNLALGQEAWIIQRELLHFQLYYKTKW